MFKKLGFALFAIVGEKKVAENVESVPLKTRPFDQVRVIYLLCDTSDCQLSLGENIGNRQGYGR